MFDRLSAQRLLALFFASCALLNFPLLMLWSVDATVAGVAVLPLALFVLWGGLIFTLAWFLERGASDALQQDLEDEQ